MLMEALDRLAIPAIKGRILEMDMHGRVMVMQQLAALFPANLRQHDVTVPVAVTCQGTTSIRATLSGPTVALAPTSRRSNLMKVVVRHYNSL